MDKIMEQIYGVVEKNRRNAIRFSMYRRILKNLNVLKSTLFLVLSSLRWQSTRFETFQNRRVVIASFFLHRRKVRASQFVISQFSQDVVQTAKG